MSKFHAFMPKIKTDSTSESILNQATKIFKMSQMKHRSKRKRNRKKRLKQRRNKQFSLEKFQQASLEK